jgi:hypothetical protein
MEAEDKLRRGVEQRVAHLIVDPGVTVTEHLQGLTRNQQDEFAEFRRYGSYIIRATDELEAPNRDADEARQSTPEFAFIARNSKHEYVFQDVAQAIEFVDLGTRLCGENPDAECKRVWFRELYSRFLYERDTARQQELLDATMRDMREMASVLAPLDPGKSALIFVSRLYPEAYKEIIENFGRDPGRRALNYVRELAHQETGIENRTDAVAAMRRRESDKWGEVKGRTAREREQRALEFLERHDPDAYTKIHTLDPREVYRQALEFLSEKNPEAYNRCHRQTPEQIEGDLQSKDEKTITFDPEKIKSVQPPPSYTPTASNPMREAFEKILGASDPGKRALALVRQQALEHIRQSDAGTYRSLVEAHGDKADARALKILARDMPELFGHVNAKTESEREAQALAHLAANQPEIHNLLTQEALELSLHQTVTLDEQSPAYEGFQTDEASRHAVDDGREHEDPSARDFDSLDPYEIELAYADMIEGDPGQAVRDAGRMSSDYVVVGQVYDVPPAPAELLNRDPALRATFEEFETIIAQRIWDGESIPVVFSNFNGYLDRQHTRELIATAREHLGLPDAQQPARELRELQQSVTRVAQDVAGVEVATKSGDRVVVVNRWTPPSGESQSRAQQLLSLEKPTVEQWVNAATAFMRSVVADEAARTQRERGDDPEAKAEPRRAEAEARSLLGGLEGVSARLSPQQQPPASEVNPDRERRLEEIVIDAARAHLAAGRHADAIDACTAVIERADGPSPANPADLAELHMTRGAAHARAGSEEQARSDFGAAVLIGHSTGDAALEARAHLSLLEELRGVMSEAERNAAASRAAGLLADSKDPGLASRLSAQQRGQSFQQVDARGETRLVSPDEQQRSIALSLERVLDTRTSNPAYRAQLELAASHLERQLAARASEGPRDSSRGDAVVMEGGSKAYEAIERLLGPDVPPLEQALTYTDTTIINVTSGGRDVLLVIDPHGRSGAVSDNAGLVIKADQEFARELIESQRGEAPPRARDDARAAAPDARTQSPGERADNLRTVLERATTLSDEARHDVSRAVADLRAQQNRADREEVLNTIPRTPAERDQLLARLERLDAQAERIEQTRESLSLAPAPTVSESRDGAADQSQPQARTQPDPARAAEPQPQPDHARDELESKAEINRSFGARVETMLTATREAQAEVSARAVTLDARLAAREGDPAAARDLFSEAFGVARDAGLERTAGRIQLTAVAEIGAHMTAAQRAANIEEGLSRSGVTPSATTTQRAVEAVRVHAAMLAREGDVEGSRAAFGRATRLADAAADRDAAGSVRVTMLSELGEHLGRAERESLYEAARSSLQGNNSRAVSLQLDAVNPAREGEMPAVDTLARPRPTPAQVSRVEGQIQNLEAQSDALERKIIGLENLQRDLDREHAAMSDRLAGLSPRDAGQQPGPANLYIDHGAGRMTPVRTEGTFQYYLQKQSQYLTARNEQTIGIAEPTRSALASKTPPEPSVYSSKEGRSLSQRSPEHEQLYDHFRGRMFNLTERSHPELGRMSRDPDFREAALVMRDAYDPEGLKKADAYLRVVGAQGRDARDRSGSPRFSKNDIKLLQTIKVQAPEIHLAEQLRELPANERGLARAQALRDDRIVTAARQSEEAKVVHTLEQDLRSRVAICQQKGLDPQLGVRVFFALTINEKMDSGKRSELYPLFASLSEPAQHAVHAYARETRLSIPTQQQRAEVGAITKASPTLKAYLSTVERLEKEDGLDKTAARAEAWKHSREWLDVGSLPADKGRDATKHLASAHASHQRLERMLALRDSVWAQATAEADRNPFGQTLPSRNEREIEEARLKSSRRDDKTAGDRQKEEMRGAVKLDPRQHNTPDRIREIFARATPETRQTLNGIERGITAAKLEMARHFLEVDRAAGRARSLEITFPGHTRTMTDRASVGVVRFDPDATQQRTTPVPPGAVIREPNTPRPRDAADQQDRTGFSTQRDGNGFDRARSIEDRMLGRGGNPAPNERNTRDKGGSRGGR